jgi:hypothetical protein
MIHRKIVAFNDKAKSDSDPSSDLDQIVSVSLPLDVHQLQSTRLIGSEHVSLGAPSPSVTIAEVEQRRVDDEVFMDFCKKIGKAFSNYLNERISFNADDEVCICFQSCWNDLTFYLMDHAIQAVESEVQWHFELS